jgi:bifunctional non-homologous end joining protein LigD
MAGMDLELDGHIVRVSHPDRIVFPAVGVTKGELVEHYRTVASRMLPFLRGRPVSMQRVHDSVESQVFYQKAAPAFYPAWIHRATVPKTDGTVTHAVCEDAATLVYLANQNCITPHVWLSRQPHLERPDRLIVDLDPGPAGLEGARLAARITGDALGEAGLAPHLMATGSNGFHVVAPIEPAETFDTVAEVAWRFAAVLAGRAPDRLTTEFYKEKRGARVYLDMARNTWAQTAVPPYAVRVRSTASVAVPLGWDELDTAVPDAWTVRTIAERLRAADPWAGVETHAAPIDRLRAWVGRAT